MSWFGKLRAKRKAPPPVEGGILGAASALDQGRPLLALRRLAQLDGAALSDRRGPAVRALWLNALTRAGASPTAPEGWKTAVALLQLCEAAPKTPAEAFNTALMAQLGDALAELPATVLARLLPGCIEKLTADTLWAAMAPMLVHQHGAAVLLLWQRLLAKNPAQQASHVFTLQMLRALRQITPTPEKELIETCRAAGRDDLAAMCAVHASVRDGFETMLDTAQRLLDAKGQRYLVHELCWMRLFGPQIEAAARFAKACGADDFAPFARVWQAAMRDDWETVRAGTQEPPKRGPVPEMRIYAALAQSKIGALHVGKRGLDLVRNSAATPWYLRDFASRAGASLRLEQDGATMIAGTDLPKVGAGRPVAQALWVGKTLPWPALLSIASFLDNGWRYQLYAYDPPENLPDGVELLDASAILPRKTLFRESASSLTHRGSLGAFSDLFRYALLAQRGGLWVDTDLINLHPFEPQGRLIIGTEAFAPGVPGLNGAVLASPANGALITQALERAEKLHDAPDLHFCRLGPQLLADLVRDLGAQGAQILRPEAINAVLWNQVHRFLAPPETGLAALRGTGAVGLHLYTESWRISGLDLAKPPPATSFVGALYDGLVNGAPDGRALMDRLRAVT